MNKLKSSFSFRDYVQLLLLYLLQPNVKVTISFPTEIIRKTDLMFSGKK